MEFSLDPLAVRQPSQSERVMRALDIKGDLPGYLDPRFQLGLNVDDFTKAEYLYLQRRLLVGSSVSSVAVAAQFSHVGFGYQFALGTGEQRLTVLTGFWIVNTTAGALGYIGGLANTDCSALGSGVPDPLDSRFQRNGVNTRPRVQALSGSNPTLRLSANMFWHVPAASTLFVPVDAVVTSAATGYGTSQGGIFLVAGALVNQPVSCTFLYQEREALQSEFA